MIHHGAQLVAFHHFLLEQEAGDALEDVAVVAQDAASDLVRVGDDLLDLFVDDASGLFAIVAAFGRDAKLQEAAAIYVPKVTQQSVDVLKRYAETIYLTQTYEKKDGQLTRFLNLEDAFATWRPSSEAREWRTHIHVPVFLDDLGAFRTTRFAIEDALRFHKANPLSRQLEIETYTWDVLPDSLKTGNIIDYICQEIEWVRGQLS